MNDTIGQPTSSNVTTDLGLLCPTCDYNLTGIATDRCPECGHTLQWDEIRREHALESSRTGTHWERYHGVRKPLGFLVTALRAALVPWLFAGELSSKPALRPALTFLTLCIFLGMLVAIANGVTGALELVMWVIGVICQVVLQTIVFGLLLPPGRMKYGFHFWLGTSAYTSYPLLLEGFRAPPHILWAQSNVWPFSLWGGSAELLTTVLFHLWWAGLVVISAMRLNCRRRRRVLLIIFALPAMTYASSYTGCYLGELVV